MHILDYIVLVLYFFTLIGVGFYAARRVKKQEDYFMGGRSFGKLIQTFAAFGAGTGSADPVNTARTTFTSGLSGMWSVMTWLFVTPFYWITGVWYRRMRHLTLGDWFVERYQSRALGAAYTVFGLMFFIVYGSMMFTAIGKVAAPLIGVDEVSLGGRLVPLEYVLVPIIGVVVLVYGMAGGLRAAYLTDVIQGMCIIALSVLLIPFGLKALVDTDPHADAWWEGFRIMHERLSEDMFTLVGSTIASDFPLHRIVAVVIMLLIGIVVQPHFIATGGGSAKTEWNARVGLVFGNFLKRFCTIGWVLTALIALTLYAGDPELLSDPDRTWGVASRDLLGPGLTGLMLACLLAALMSSIDAYMIVGSGLVVRNIYAAYINKDAGERTYIWTARITGIIVVGGAIIVALAMSNVFKQLQLTWVFPVLFAAPFWVGMYWRRASLPAAWVTVLFCLSTFFLIPFAAPRLVPSLRTNPKFLVTTRTLVYETTRPATIVDVEQENARRLQTLRKWQAQREAAEAIADAPRRKEALAQLPPKPDAPDLLRVGDPYTIRRQVGGTAVFWSALETVDANGNPTAVSRVPVGEPRRIDEQTTEVVVDWPEGTRLVGVGNFRLDYLLYQLVGVDFSKLGDATISTMELVPKIIAPFLVMILVSLVTQPPRKEAIDRYYAKMHTPVDPDPQQDRANLEDAFAHPERMEQRKLFPGTQLEFQRPTKVDIFGFLVSFAVCFAIIGVAAWIGTIGRP